MAALLHDLIEDTAVTQEDIQEEFGEHVLDIVEATTFDEMIEDRYDRFEDTFRRCAEQGREALVVKAADILDNSAYYHLASTEEDRQYLLDKMECFVDVAASEIGDEPIHQDLKRESSKVRVRIEDEETA